MKRNVKKAERIQEENAYDYIFGYCKMHCFVTVMAKKNGRNILNTLFT